MFQPFTAWARHYAPLLEEIDFKLVGMTASSITLKVDVISVRRLESSECGYIQDLLLPYARPYFHALGAVVANVRGLEDMHLEVHTEWFYYE